MTFSLVLGTAMSFLPLKFSLSIVYLTFAPIKAPNPNTFVSGRSGAPQECTTTSLFIYYHMVKLHPTQTKG